MRRIYILASIALAALTTAYIVHRHRTALPPPTYGAHNERAAACPVFAYSPTHIEYRAPLICTTAVTNAPPTISHMPTDTNDFIEVATVILAEAGRPVPRIVGVEIDEMLDSMAVLTTDTGATFTLTADADEIPDEVVWTLTGDALPPPRTDDGDERTP